MTSDMAQQHRSEWQRRMAVLSSESLGALAPHVTSAESFTGGVSKTVVGSKAYWHEAFLELIALAQMHGVPEIFATFTANEMVRSPTAIDMLN